MDKIIQKWSLEVVAIPQEEIINLPTSTTTDKTIPLKVKIRLKRGKNNSVFRQKVISVPKIEQSNGYIEKVRVIHSDQTIMSFNMLTEPDHKSKTRRKSQNKFFHLFKTGKCLGTHRQDKDDPPYMIATTIKSNEVDAESQVSYDEKQNISLLQNKFNTKALDEVINQPVFFLGKCKQGGCLDPPFGEDRYRYQPSIKAQGPELINKENYQVTLCEKTHEKKSKRSEITVKISNYEEIDALSTFMLYKAKSEKSSLDDKYSDSIITYPPDTLSQDLGVLEKNTMTRKSSVVKSRLSSNVTDTYFMPPKVERSPERNLNGNKISINSHKGQLKDCFPSNDISNHKDRDTNSLLPKSGDLYITEDAKNIALNIKEIEEPATCLKIKTDKLHETNKKSSTHRNSMSQNDSQMSNYISKSIVYVKSQQSETEELNEKVKYKRSTDNNDYNEIPKTVKNISQISDDSSPVILGNNMLRELENKDNKKDNDTKSESFTIIKNEDNELSKQTNITNNINDVFSQEYFNLHIPFIHPVKIKESNVTTPEYTNIEIPYAMQTSSSNKSNYSQPNLNKHSSISIVTLDNTKENGAIVLKNIDSQVECKKDSSITSDNNLAERKLKYDNDLIPQIVKKNSSDLNIKTTLPLSEYTHTVKSNIGLQVTNSSPTKGYLSDVITKEQIKNQDKDVIQNLEILDHTVLQTNGYDSKKYNQNIKDEKNSLVIPEKSQFELTINPSFDKNENTFKIPSDEYTLETNSKVGNLQLDKDFGETFSHKAHSKENIQDDNENSDKDYKDVPKIQETEEISKNMVYKLKDYHQEDIKPIVNINDNIIVTSAQKEGQGKSNENLIHRDASSLSTRPMTEFLHSHNKSHNKRSSLNSQHIALDEQTKPYSIEPENTNIIDNSNYVTHKDSITNLKRNIDRELLLKNEIDSVKIPKNIIPFITEDTLSETLTTKNSILSTSEMKSINSVIHKNESESDFQNYVKNTSSKDNKNAVMDTVVENANISQEKLNTINVPLPVKNVAYETTSATKYLTDTYFNGSHDTLKQDFKTHARNDVRISFEDKKSRVAKASLENNMNKTIIVDLAFQTYVNENNETILRTFDISKEPQRFPQDSISVIKSALQLNNNKLTLPINSQTKLSIEICEDNNISKNVEEISPELKEIMEADDVINKENDKYMKYLDLSDIEILQSSLATIYEYDLIPVENLIRNLIVDIDKIAKFQFLNKKKCMVTKKLKSLKPTYCSKRCGCLKK